MKKTVKLIISVLLLVSLTGCKKESDSLESYDVTVYGSIFSGYNDGISLQMKFDPAWITKESDTKYNKDLAQFCALLCQDSYFRSKDLAKNRANRVIFDAVGEDGYDNTYFLKQLGYEDVRYIEASTADNDSDIKDYGIYVIGYKNIDDKYDSFIVVFRGCFSADEWYSIYDIGNEYEKCHPDWNNKDNNKGTDVAANRAIKTIDEYITSHDDANRKNTILVSGHSRGGGIAQIVGAYYEDNKNFKSYCYCFNSAKVSRSADVQKYKTIFNIYDENDYFSDYLPFASQQLYHYGKELTINVFNNTEVLNEINSLHNNSCYVSMNADELQSFKDKFAAVFTGRSSLYDQHTITEYIGNLDEEEMVSSYQAMIDSLTINEQCWLTVENDELTITYNDAALLLGLGRVLSYGQSQLDCLKVLFEQETEYLLFCDSIMENYSKISGAHLLLDSYVISRYVGK